MSTYRNKDFDFPSFETQTENQTLSQPYNNPYLSKHISCLIIWASLVVFSLVFFFALKCLKKLINHQNTNRIDPLHIDVEMGHQHRVDMTERSSWCLFSYTKIKKPPKSILQIKISLLFTVKSRVPTRVTD